MMQQQQQNNYSYTHSSKPAAQLAHLAAASVVRKPAYTQTQKFKSKCSLSLSLSLFFNKHNRLSSLMRINAHRPSLLLSSHRLTIQSIYSNNRPLPCWCSIPLALICSHAPTGHPQDKDAGPRRQGHCMVCSLHPRNRPSPWKGLPHQLHRCRSPGNYLFFFFFFLSI